MKKISIKKLYFILAILLFATSCDKKLDVVPQQNITPDQIKTAGDVKAVLFGAYTLLQSPNSYGERVLFVADLLAAQTQLNFIGTFGNYRDIFRKEQISNNSVASGMWANAYTTINVANTVLDKLDLITDAAEKAAIEGEAKFIRAIVYLELVNFFAKPYSFGNTAAIPGVPLILEPVYDFDPATAFVSRASVEAVYTQIVADLTDAAAKLPAEQDNARATKFSAQAFLSRVYMNQAKYQEAATAANAVIASNLYGLMDFDAAFNNANNSPEDIFAIQQTSQSNAGTTNNGMTTFFAAQPVGRGDAQVPTAYVNLFGLSDARRAFFYNGVSIGGTGGRYTEKYAVLYSVIPIVRLAEMYLTRGEANYRKGGAPVGGVTPLADINTVRGRAGATPLLAIASGTDFVTERFLELGFEGDRVWTLKRLKLNIDNRAYDDNKLILPIPQREMDVNDNLVQNDGYN